MITTLRKFEIRSAETNNLIASYELKLNGYTYELHTMHEIIFRGIEAERRFNECLELNKMVVSKMDDLKLVEFKEVTK
jgi:hypothetical protein